MTRISENCPLLLKTLFMIHYSYTFMGKHSFHNSVNFFLKTKAVYTYEKEFKYRSIFA